MARRKRPEPVPPEPLAPLFDAHTHLASCGARDAEGVRALMDRAEAVGVGRVCTVGDGLEEARLAVAASEADERVYAAAAIHPTRSAELDDAARAAIEELCRRPRTVAVGEAGLDWYWTEHSGACADPATQEEAFRWHIDLAKRLGKPLMIHNRDADDDVLRILREEGEPETVILHCFSSGVDVAREAVDRGYVLSFAGPVTFPANEGLRAAARLTPVSQMMVETDAPYLTPMPFRGARNEPMYVPYTVRSLAETLGRDAAELAAELTATTERVYGLR